MLTVRHQVQVTRIYGQYLKKKNIEIGKWAHEKIPPLSTGVIILLLPATMNPIVLINSAFNESVIQVSLAVKLFNGCITNHSVLHGIHEIGLPKTASLW